jgi:hypothetical protein
MAATETATDIATNILMSDAQTFTVVSVVKVVKFAAVVVTFKASSHVAPR